MLTLLSLLIVAIAPAAANDGPPGEAVVVFSTGFEEDADLDFDLWPDGWIRRRGPGYPRYVGMQIVDPALIKSAAPQPPAPEGRRVLRVELDGGAAGMSSGQLPFDADYSFVLEGWVRAEGLRHDDATIFLSVHDEEGQAIEQFRSTPLSGTSPWTRLRVGPIHATDDRAVRLSIGLQVASRDGQRHDIRGAACFDGLWLGRLPKLSISAGNGLHLFTDPGDVEITCDASGVSGADTAVRFELLDAVGNLVDQAEMPLRPAAQPPEEARAARSPASNEDATVAPPDDSTTGSAGAASGSVVWRPKLANHGFYRARVTMAGHEQVALEREITLAVLDPQPAPTRGEFGWTMPNGEGPFRLAALPGLMAQMGVNWAKFPLWHGERDMARSAALAAFDERLRARHIELIGLLTNPPEELRARFGHASHLQAADIFLADSEVWYPSLEPVMSGLSMKIQWWQLGADGDTSFVGDPRTPATIERVRRQLALLGPNVRLGLAWGWINEIPHVDRPAWQALALSAEPPLTSGELAAYLDSIKNSDARRWVVLDPLPHDEYPPATRADDLVQRILAAKIHGADAIFIPDPCDERRGLFRPDGTPGEMLLPWRTAALALAGSEYLGSESLPGGSTNHVFSRGRDAVMVVWNETPGQETLFLGEDAVQTDVWGRRRRLATQAGRQTIEVGPSPVFVSGINDPIMRMVMTTRFDRTQVPSIFGESHHNTLRFRNYFPVGARGKLRLVAPEGWIVQPSQVDFKLAAGEEVELPLELKFSYAASSGPQQVRLEFELTTDATYRFDVVRTIEVGLGDVTLDVSTRLNERGELVVEQRITNHTDQPVSFKCDLSVPQYRFMRSQVWELARGTDTQTYPLAEGGDVIGQTIWIRAQEIKGSRVLSRRYVAQP
jgi:hypothetical protein